MFIKYSMICYAYCLMDNHYHLFIKTNKSNLSQGIHYLNSAYTNWFRNKHQIIGPLFQGRFKSILVDTDNYALTPLFRGLKGDKILLEAMSSHRPYRPALGIDAALEEISKNKGILYDPEVVDICIRLVREKGFKFES